MTLDQSHSTALAAAQAGDLEMLGKALRARAQAIAQLKRQPPSPHLASRMRDAIEAGRAIAGALFVLKQRLGFESARLRQLKNGLAIGCGLDSRR